MNETPHTSQLPRYEHPWFFSVVRLGTPTKNHLPMPCIWAGVSGFKLVSWLTSFFVAI
jgi:hypothetical protein